jgi:hypothetical protein
MRGKEITFPRGNGALIFLELPRLFFMAHGGARKFARDIVEFVDARNPAASAAPHGMLARPPRRP